MSHSEHPFWKSRKVLIIIAGIIVFLGIVLVIWNKYKYEIVGDKISSTVAQKTDSLYYISYDSLYFDEALGNAFIQNIHVAPDTAKIKGLGLEKMPSVFLDIKIQSIKITGVKTIEALEGANLQGDSVIIDAPQIEMYSLKQLSQKTKIESEAASLYEEILGKLDFIKVNFIFINNVNVSGYNFLTKHTNFQVYNGKVKIENIVIDSVHNEEKNRVLFSKQLIVTADSFVTYNNNRKEFFVDNINYSGGHQSMRLKEIVVNRFEDDSSQTAHLLVKAKNLRINGINSDSVVKAKNFLIDTITCDDIAVYQPPKIEISPNDRNDGKDSTGFMQVYSVYLKHLQFPKVSFVAYKKNNFHLGNISLTINDVKADQLSKIESHPFNYSREVKIELASLSSKSSDKKYTFTLKNLLVNSLDRTLNIHSFNVIPYAGEKKFAQNEKFQRDRYDLKMNHLLFSGIEMDDILDGKIIASKLSVKNTNAKIYRDLTKPLKKESKVGNYPSQLVQKLNFPIRLDEVVLNNAYIEYREKQEKTDTTGVISFSDATLNVKNITNMDAAIKQNKELTISFDARALKKIPLKGNFIFMMDDSDGRFRVNGKTGGFDADILNEVSIPMALIRLKQGHMNSLEFHFTGNNTSASGNVILKYNDLKVDVLKMDKETNDIKKRGFLSLFANVIVKNDNPSDGELRNVKAHYERNIYKSFFNLVWKTLFDGLKKSTGVP